MHHNGHSCPNDAWFGRPASKAAGEFLRVTNTESLSSSSMASSDSGAISSSLRRSHQLCLPSWSSWLWTGRFWTGNRLSFSRQLSMRMPQPTRLNASPNPLSEVQRKLLSTCVLLTVLHSGEGVCSPASSDTFVQPVCVHA